MQRPKFLATCMYGIIFILLGNLAGNAIAFGSYIMAAAGREDSHGAILGLAIAGQTFACLLHMFSRRGGLLVNNLFAIFKVMLLMTIIVFGFWYRAGNRFADTNAPPSTAFDTKESFLNPRSDLASYSNAFLYVMYAYSGVEQPFYVSHVPNKNCVQILTSATDSKRSSPT